MRSLLLTILAPALVAASGPDPAAPEWKDVPAVKVALHRTPPVYGNEPPAALEIPSVEMKVLHAGGKTLVRLAWADPSPDAPAVDHFADACAVMAPARPIEGDLFPSLQMGDAAHPVTIYFYDTTRGPAVMEASGRGTTKRTGKTFPAAGAYGNRAWVVAMELPPIAAGTPISVAVWNGSQKDRDGRKYFSIWQKIR